MILAAVSHPFLGDARQELRRGNNPELTVCQVRTSTSAAVRRLWLSAGVTPRLLEQTAEELRYTQVRRTGPEGPHERHAPEAALPASDSRYWFDADGQSSGQYG